MNFSSWLNHLIGFISVCGIFASPLAVASGGDHIGNGAGLSESRLAYAVLQIDTYLIRCIGSDLCKMTEAEKSVLSQVHQKLESISLDERLPLTYQVRGPSAPLFKTSHRIGAPVEFNRDLIYPVTPETHEQRALSVSEAIGLIAEVLADQAGAEAGMQADIFDKVSKTVSANTTEKSLAFIGSPKLSVETVDFENGEFGILLNGAHETLDLTPALNKTLDTKDLLTSTQVEWARMGIWDEGTRITTSFVLTLNSDHNRCRIPVKLNLVEENPSSEYLKTRSFTLAPVDPYQLGSALCAPAK